MASSVTESATTGATVYYVQSAVCTAVPFSVPSLGTTTASPWLRAAQSWTRQKTRWDWGWTTAQTVRSDTPCTGINWRYQYQNSVLLFDFGFLYVDAMIAMAIVCLSLYSRPGQSLGLLHSFN